MLEAARRQARGLSQTSHRPWPAPTRPWVQGQTWEHLLFAHWAVDESEVRALVPAALQLDLWDGTAWLGVTPFGLTGLRLRGLPPVPFASAFLELNVRTYVRVGDRPGIFFFSLDASRLAAVQAARRLYRLPYHWAAMSAIRRGDDVEYESTRRGRSPRRRLHGSYRPAGPVRAAVPGTLEHWLTERYCLYTVHEQAAYRAEIHHPPWPLQGAEAELHVNTMAPTGVRLPGDEPLLHFAARQDVVVWGLERVERGG